ncbi:MAG: Sir2 family NAD-dependent protein deacetylase [Eubacteriales bacterium]|nr:Sir2 family NAD-dependent protein deacetylase [Eubacteriales bacterium]
MSKAYEEKISFLRNVIDRSHYMVCLFGVGISAQCGCINYRDEEASYDIEEKYGYSPDEMFNVTFFNTRVDQFYEFYKRDMLNNLGTVAEGLSQLRRLEEQGKLQSIITRDIYSLPKRAGCKKVYELHGSVYRNYCPHCGREYPVEYIQNSQGVPRCESCGVVIRPDVSMVGEIVDNGLISRAAQEVRKADTLLVLGCTLKASLTNTFLRYFNGDELVLINSREHFADSKADLVIHGNPMDILQDLGI